VSENRAGNDATKLLSPEQKRARAAALCIDERAPLVEAFAQMDRLDRKLLIVTGSSGYVSLLSIGDIQRHLMRGGDLNTECRAALRPNVRSAAPGTERAKIRETMMQHRAEFMPIVDAEGRLHDIVFWEDLFPGRRSMPTDRLRVPTVIMAGGQGSRLKPITNIIPKPLLPIGERTILEIIMDSFHEAGVSEFHVSVNYKAEMIEYYFAQAAPKPYSISYFREPIPLGTAGSLALLKSKIDSPFFVSNCDILIDQDYQDIYSYHRETRCDLTVVAALKTYRIPYGTLEAGPDGLLASLREKPTLNVLANTGIYVLEPHLLDEIPSDRMFHITELMECVRARGGRVGVFPISEGAWLDIGEWDEYQRSQVRFNQRARWSASERPPSSQSEET
jgi:dTDP-glucose pyrophosphorylase/CBS domain-containing protein